ncbi:MAG: hypothetical protein AAGC55_00980 [Myxococcota bacterium]
MASYPHALESRVTLGPPNRATRLAAATAALVALAALVGCGPRVQPEGPSDGPEETTEEEVAATAVTRPAPPPVREALIGEMCPGGAAGRPAIMPLFLRSVTWTADSDTVSLPIERRRARQFSVMSWDGRRAGIFSVAGTADVGLERRAAIGAYAGNSPCTRARDSDGGGDGDEPACIKAQSHCGLALAVLEPTGGGRPFEEDPDPASFQRSGACVAGDKLLVDIDGDGDSEAYPVADFLDPVRAPAEEVLSVPRGTDSCQPAFSVRNVLPAAAPTRWQGRKLHHWRGLDLLGVVDIDGDSRHEIVVSYHYAERRTWAVYSALSTVARLDLVGEALPWPTR